MSRRPNRASAPAFDLTRFVLLQQSERSVRGRASRGRGEGERLSHGGRGARGEEGGGPGGEQLGSFSVSALIDTGGACWL